MILPAAERPKVSALLEELARSVEELLLSGLTTASEATRKTLDVSFREASRMRLLRLGSTLRVANEELGRYTRNDPEFSAKRLSFFLNRTWLLSHGLHRALARNDEAEFDRLLWTPASEPIASLELVTVGVVKKVAARAFCAFDFRLRTLSASGSIPAGARLAWSCVFPIKPEAAIPAEGYLHLPQKQKFKAAELLESKTIHIEHATVALDGFGGGRISLTEESKLTLGAKFTDWQRFQLWDAAAALARLAGHQAGPLDLDVELQEEVVLDPWTVEEPFEKDQQWLYPITAGPLAFEAVSAKGVEGEALGKRMLEFKKKKKVRPPLFGLMHYERCRMVLQPLTVFADEGPVHLMLSDQNIDRKALLQALKFT